jgi:hypothetical protein
MLCIIGYGIRAFPTRKLFGCIFFFEGGNLVYSIHLSKNECATIENARYIYTQSNQPMARFQNVQHRENGTTTTASAFYLELGARRKSRVIKSCKRCFALKGIEHYR